MLWIRGTDHKECMNLIPGPPQPPVLCITEVSGSENSEQEKHPVLFRTGRDYGKII